VAKEQPGIPQPPPPTDGRDSVGGAATQASLSGLAADEYAVDPTVDVDTNLLRAGIGQLCPRCGREIEPGRAVRRRVSGAYQHDTC
jgi:hypothetical protein